MTKILLRAFLLMFLISVLLSTNVAAQDCTQGQEKCLESGGQNYKQICSEGAWESVLGCSYGCNLTNGKATCMSPPPAEPEGGLVEGPEEIAVSGGSLLSSTILNLLIFLIIPLLSFVLFILSLISILTSRNKTGWKILWIIICLTIIGILVYFIVGRRQRIKKAIISDVAEIKEEQRVEEEEVAKGKEEVNVIRGNEEKLQSSMLLTKEIPEELKQTVDYIKTSFAQGFSRDQINQALIKSGWTQDKIEDAFRFAE